MKTTITNFICAIAALLIPTAVLAQEIQQTIDGFSYLLYPSDLTAKVSYNKSVEVTDLVIPETVTYNDVVYTVTGLKSGAFEENSNIVTVSLPKTITKLEGGVFKNCPSLTTVTFADDCTSLSIN